MHESETLKLYDIMVDFPVTKMHHYNNMHVCSLFQLIIEQKALMSQTRPKPAQKEIWRHRIVKKYGQPTPTSPPPTSRAEPLTNEQLWK